MEKINFGENLIKHQEVKITLEQRGVQCLGELTEEEKNKSCWLPESISGSKVNRMFNEPKKLFNETMHGTKPIFSEKTLEKIEAGKRMEPVIVEMAKNELGFDIVVFKETLKLADKEWYANLDGISPDGNTIYEIKNTEIGDINKVFDRYRWQPTFYCWLTGAEKFVLIAYINGCKLRYIEYKPIKKDYDKLLEKINNFIISVQNNTWAPFVEEDDKTVYLLTEDYDTKLLELNELEKQKAKLDAEIKAIKEDLMNYAKQYDCNYWEDSYGNKFAISTSTRKGGVYLEQLIHDNPNLVIPYKPDVTSTSFRFTPKKEKKEDK